MFWRHKKKQSDEKITVGIDAQEDGVAVAVARQKGASTKLMCDFVPFSTGHDIPKILAKLTEQRKLHGQRAVFVLEGNEYSLLRTSTPLMSMDEMRVAARWKVTEFIDFPAENAILDVYEVPEAGQKGGERALNVVAAKRDYIQGHVDEMRKAALEPLAIDISELALRNVIARMEKTPNGVIVLHLVERSGLLVVIKQNEVYLTRRIDVGYSDLLLGDQRQFDGVVLELQRSLDYFESQFSQALPSKLLIFPPDKLSNELIAHINSQLNLQVEPLILESMPGYIVEANEESQSRCLLAVGAALRDEDAA